MTVPNYGAMPLGATWDGKGVHFAVFSENATAVDVCLFDAANPVVERQRASMQVDAQLVWRCFVPGVRPGHLYGFRAHGAYEPHNGHRFNANKLLIDPYARALRGTLKWNDALYDYEPGGGPEAGPSTADSAPYVPKSIVADIAYDWGDDQGPGTPWSDTVIYECHVKGMTMLHPDVEPALRGKYSALASRPIVEHLLSLGVTAVKLLPVHHSVSERALQHRGLTNYWGYNSIAYFAPDSRYATGDAGEQVTEFRNMVKELHRAGLEVILDVVYNHTGEGDRLGPTLSMRGLENSAYYLLDPGDAGRYLDFTGCGNTLNIRHTRALHLVLDSLRYWVREMHVDGFRFDLAAVLGRTGPGFRSDAELFEIIRSDPLLTHVKLIAEPWDVGPAGYHAGGFPADWSEWNDKFRDTVRRFWRGDPGIVPQLSSRLAGSSDMYAWNARSPRASINYITAHDGFTLHDLVSYERKHNEANGEDNRDGADTNFSLNNGAEGPSDDAAVVEGRERLKRSMLMTLAFSLGVPMLSHGDEIQRSQQGNNNVYAQDNETSWLNWELDRAARSLLDFTRRVFAIRRSIPLWRRTSFMSEAAGSSGVRDVIWLAANGEELHGDAWGVVERRSLQMLLDAHASTPPNAAPDSARGPMLLLLNANDAVEEFTLPPSGTGAAWRVLLNSADPADSQAAVGPVLLQPHSAVLLQSDRATAP